jgi:beta-galactosidase GanA
MKLQAGPAPDAGVSQRPDEFIYGSAFYRPPNPPRAMRREMLRAIAQDYKFNIIRIYPGWDYYNPGPDKFVFDDVDEVMGYCDEFGIRVLLGAVLESAPWWLEQAHPQCRYVDAKGQIRRLAGSGNNMTGGWPGLCWDWQPIREAAGRYLQALARFASTHRSLYAYDCWNEPHIEPAWERNIWAQPQEYLFCYCDRTIAAFHQWLRKRYGTLDRLNEAWTRRYPSFESIDPPRAMGTYADWVDWRRFIIERSTEELKFRVQNLRAVDKRTILEDHAAHHPPLDGIAVGGIDSWRLAEVVDQWGLSLFPRWFSFSVYEGAAKVDVTRSCANGKTYWMTELQGGHGNKGLWHSHRMRPQDIRLWNWMAVAYGARGVIYWTYHAEATGSESTGFGLVTRDGQPTERVREAARNKRLIQEHFDLIRNFKPQPAVALLTDPDSALLTYAANGMEEPSTNSFRGYYRALWNLDLQADFIQPDQLSTAGKYKVIIAPWHLVGKEQTCRALRRLVEAGCTLILETSMGLFDDRFFANMVVPPHGLAEAFGYREGESYYIPSEADQGATTSAFAARNRPADVAPSDRIYESPELDFTEPAAIRVRGNYYVTPITVTSAKVIGTCQGEPVAAVKALGSGRVYYIGTNLGASIATGDNRGIELLRAIIRPVVQPAVTGGRLRPRLVHSGNGPALLIVFNDTVEEQTSRIVVPPPFSRATDIHSRNAEPVNAGAIDLTVPHQDVRVLLLE